MREMKSAPEKIVILEVAMVRLIKPELDSSIDALDERMTKLERDGVRVEPVRPRRPRSFVRLVVRTGSPPTRRRRTPARAESTAAVATRRRVAARAR